MRAPRSRSPRVSKVTVVEPPAGDRVLVEAGQRIRVGAGRRRSEQPRLDLRRRRRRRAAATPPRRPPRSRCRAQDGLATIRVIASLPDGYELHRLIRGAARRGRRRSAVLAVRAVELLRDIYLDVPREMADREAPPPAPAPPPTVAIAAVAPEPVVPLERTPMRVFLGAAVLGGRRGLGPAIAPVLGVTVPLRYGFALAGRRRARSRGWSATPTRERRRRPRRWSAARRSASRFRSARSVRSRRWRAGVHFIRAEGTPSGEQGFPQSAEGVRLCSRSAPAFGLVSPLARGDRADRVVLHAADDGHSRRRHARGALGRPVAAGPGRAVGLPGRAVRAVF